MTEMTQHNPLPTLLLCTLLATTAYAAEPTLDEALGGFDSAEPSDDSLDAVLEGFDDSSTTASPQPTDETPEQSGWQLTGDLSLSISYNFAHQTPTQGETDYRGLSRLRSFTNLEFGGDLGKNWAGHIEGHLFYDAAYSLNGRDNYTRQVLDAYESEAEWDSVYLRGRLAPSLDLKLGRQIVVWGKSDNLRVTDILNPLDQREPGMTDIEELRLPVTMAKLDYYVGDWNLSAMAIPEVRFSKLPPYGSDFYPLLVPPSNEEVPADGIDNMQFAAAANGIFSGWDLSLYWAERYSDTSYTILQQGVPTQLHQRQTMLGSAVNVATGNWLWKVELAHFDDIRFNNLPERSERRSDLLLGFEYAGLHDVTLSLETVCRHLHDFDEELADQDYLEDEWQSAFRYSGDFLHARLNLMMVLIVFGEQFDEGGFGRFSAAYELAEALKLIGGMVLYEGGGRPPTLDIGNNDRLFAELKYSF
ncbi:MAG: DUF1302 family protein [Pseudomonadota bacterium]